MKITPVEAIHKVEDKQIGTCPSCGLKLYAAMMYCCPRSPCASGLGSKGSL